LLSNAHEPEFDGSTQFRWTTGNTRIAFDRAIAVGPSELRIVAGAHPPGLDPPTFSIIADGARLGPLPLGEQRRIYRVLVPERLAWSPQLTVALETSTVIVPPDTRAVGMRLEGATLSMLGGRMRWPAPGLVLAQALLLGALLVIGRRLALRSALLAGLLIAAAALELAVLATQPLVAASFTQRLALAGITLAAATVVLLPALEHAGSRVSGLDKQYMRTLWALTLLALGLRLIGALYPLYSAHDLPLNVERLERTISGTLISTNRSFEFRSGVTIYPPGPYLALLPALLAGVSPALLVQGGNAIVDGLGALAVGVLALRLGAGRRVALLATLLYAALPVMLTSLYWGHSAQVFGQGLMAPLALALLAAFNQPRRRAWFLAGALLACAFLSHIGVTIIALGWLGLLWLLVRARNTVSTHTWRQLTLTLLAAGLVGLALVYGPALALKVDQTAQVGERVLNERYASQFLIWRALLISFYTLGPALLAAGFITLALAPGKLHLPSGGTDLLLAWGAVTLLFCAVEVVTGLQVRYFVFFAPLACLLIALALDRLAGYGRIGMLVSWAIALALVVQGSAAWYNAVLNDVQMSMVPLLR
jgi:hypothetical protein